MMPWQSRRCRCSGHFKHERLSKAWMKRRSSGKEKDRTVTMARSSERLNKVFALSNSSYTEKILSLLDDVKSDFFQGMYTKVKLSLTGNKPSEKDKGWRHRGGFRTRPRRLSLLDVKGERVTSVTVRRDELKSCTVE